MPFSEWYSRQYGAWNRTRRIQASPFIATVDNGPMNRARTNSSTNGNPVPVVMTEAMALDLERGVVPTIRTTNFPRNEDHKNVETLFGPLAGIPSLKNATMGAAPQWTQTVEKETPVGVDDDEAAASRGQPNNVAGTTRDPEVTPEVLSRWVEESNKADTSKPVPTTTLQALVNLKRPSIRLTPLSTSNDPAATSDDVSDHAGKGMADAPHGLDFEYDCDAAKCSITVTAHFPKPSSTDQPAADFPSGSSSSLRNEILFDHIVEGGFGKRLTWEDGAILELAKLDAASHSHPFAGREVGVRRASFNPSASVEKLAVTAAVSSSSLSAVPVQATSSLEHSTEQLQQRTHALGVSTTRSSNYINPNWTPVENPNRHSMRSLAASTTNNSRRRFSAFHFRKKFGHSRQAVGPSLTVVDADLEAQQQQQNSDQNAEDQAERASGDRPEGANPESETDKLGTNQCDSQCGVKITITVEALDEEEKPLSVRNAQRTYLHIMRLGSAPADGEEDTRPFVVKVVRRDATIGRYNFKLQEIYGLSSGSTSTAAHPSSESQTNVNDVNNSTAPATTYPPTSQHTNANWDTPASECILCLSSPREVILLPCRHLVACKECAANMIEFGAGGQLSHETAAEGSGDGGAGGVGDGAANGEGGANETTVTPMPTRRRRRKAKGWFCPICRQPYVSLLRISAQAPPGKILSDDDTTASSIRSEPVTVPNTMTNGVHVKVEKDTDAPEMTSTTSTGLAGIINGAKSLLPNGNRAAPDDANTQATHNQPAPTTTPAS